MKRSNLFQFLSLKAGDERNQLVPVLTTMLKLSQDEKAQLQSIAQGILHLPSFSPDCKKFHKLSVHLN